MCCQPQVFKRVGWAPVRLLIFPGVVEAVVAAAVGHAVFGMPILLALAMGFILTVRWPLSCTALGHPCWTFPMDRNLRCCLADTSLTNINRVLHSPWITPSQPSSCAATRMRTEA